MQRGAESCVLHGPADGERARREKAQPLGLTDGVLAVEEKELCQDQES
jgi:hypothetical protein